MLDSPAFPALSVIRNSAPNFPARVYANEELKLVFFVSELKLDQSMYRPVANTMLQWAADSGCELVISAAGIYLMKKATGQRMTRRRCTR